MATYTAKLTKGASTSDRCALRGEIYENQILIGTFARPAVRPFHLPIEAKFRTARAKDRFSDFSDSLSISETIEALLP